MLSEIDRAARRQRVARERIVKEGRPFKAPLLGGRYVVIVHHSTKRDGFWQASFFDADMQPYSDCESRSLRRLVDTIRMDGIDWVNAESEGP